MGTRSKPAITAATADDVAAACNSLAQAFRDDPQMRYFFGDHALGVLEANRAFFSLLMRARIALGMPVWIARDHQGPVGAVMGYDPDPPDWPEGLEKEWAVFEAALPALPARFDAYERITDGFKPRVPHHYLGVIGVRSELQGTGVGNALLQTFCTHAAADPRSHGVYLETANPASLRFYLRNGFAISGEGDLEGQPLWCVFRSTR